MDSSQHWAALIESARNGCDEALAHIINQFREYLLLVADREIGMQVQAKFDASDVVQISLVEAMSAIDQFKGSSEDEIRGWLTSIVMHNLQDESRRYTKTIARSVDRENAASGILDTVEDGLGETPSAVISNSEQDQRLRLLIEQLPTQQQNVLECRHKFGMSYTRIAAKLQISEEVARKSWSRATAQLRQWLKEEDSEERSL